MHAGNTGWVVAVSLRILVFYTVASDGQRHMPVGRHAEDALLAIARLAPPVEGSLCDIDLVRKS